MMDPSGTTTPPLTRSRKRAAEAEEKRNQGNEEMENRKRPRRMFQPRKIKSTTGLGTLIGPNDIIVNRKNPQKIKIEEEVDVKATIRVVPNVEDIESSHIANVEPSHSGAKTEVSEGEENEIAKFIVSKEVPLPLDFMEVKIEEAEVIQEGTQENGTCARCKDLEKAVSEKDLRIKELEQELESQKQRHRDPLSKLIQEVDARDDIVSSNEKNKNKLVFLAILEGKPLEQIQHLVESGEEWNVPDANGDTVLHLAARTGNSELIQYFISKSDQVNANAPNLAGTTPLMEAAKTGTNFSAVFDFLIKNGADIKAKDGSERTVLHIAIAAGRSGQEIAKIVSTIKNWSFKNSRTREGFTVLHLAAENGNLEALKYFLSMNPNVNAKSKEKLTPLMLAASAKQNFIPIVDHLLQNGADINIRDNLGHNVVRHTIVLRRPLKDVEKLIDAGAIWNTESILDGTILHTCALYGHTEVLKYFIGKGGDVNAPDRSGRTPIWTVARRGLCDAMNHLIENGADFDASELLYVILTGVVFSTARARTQACDKPNVYRTMKRLFELGAICNDEVFREIYLDQLFMDINFDGTNTSYLEKCELAKRDYCGKTPVIHAILRIRDYAMICKVLDLLIENGADVNALDKDGFNALHIAPQLGGCEPGRPLETIEKLISHGATWSNGVVGNEDEYESILHAAVRGGHLELVQFFISKGVDVNARNVRGETPFLLTVMTKYKGYGDILRILVKGGADPNAVDNEGNNALLHLLTTRYNSMMLEELKLMIALGCNLDCTVTNKKGQSVASLLKEHGFWIILKYLKSF